MVVTDCLCLSRDIRPSRASSFCSLGSFWISHIIIINNSSRLSPNKKSVGSLSTQNVSRNYDRDLGAKLRFRKNRSGNQILKKLFWREKLLLCRSGIQILSFSFLRKVSSSLCSPHTRYIWTMNFGPLVVSLLPTSWNLSQRISSKVVSYSR